MANTKILIITTSHAQMGDTNRKTGLWLEELAVPYFVFRDAGVAITLASPKGGPVPLDPKSESTLASNSTVRRFKKDPEAMYSLEHTVSLGAQRADNFDMVLLTGGHGPMWDYPANEPLKQLLHDFNRQYKPIGAVCHGAVALVFMENSLGEPLVKGRRLTAFSNSEEEVSGLTAIVPFLLESKLVFLGASYSKGPDFISHTVTDGNIITGQNPASSMDVALKLLARQKELPKAAEAALN